MRVSNFPGHETRSIQIKETWLIELVAFWIVLIVDERERQRDGVLGTKKNTYLRTCGERQQHYFSNYLWYIETLPGMSWKEVALTSSNSKLP